MMSWPPHLKNFSVHTKFFDQFTLRQGMSQLNH
jgi:hypothetical protein